jgi:hypothetical protein
MGTMKKIIRIIKYDKTIENWSWTYCVYIIKTANLILTVVIYNNLEQSETSICLVCLSATQAYKSEERVWDFI